MSEQSKAPDVIWACAGAINSGVEVWEWGIAYEDFKEWSDEADFTPVEYVSRDHCIALVGAAYQSAAKCSYHDPSKEPDYPYDARGALKRAYRDDFGVVKDPDGFAGQIALHDAWQAAQDILALTPASAQAAYDAALSAARAEGYAKALEDAAALFTKDETPLPGCVVLHRLEKLRGSRSC